MTNQGKHRLLWLLPIVLLMIVLPGNAVIHQTDAIPATQNAAMPSFQTGELIIKFQPSATAAQIAQFCHLQHAFTLKTYPHLSAALGYTYMLVKSANYSVTEALSKWSTQPLIAAISPNYRRQLCRVPDDTYYQRQRWFFEKIQAPQAWDQATGGELTLQERPVIVVMDSGVDYLHPDLRDNMWTNSQETPGNGSDDDGNGYIDDYYGYDFATDSSGSDNSDPMDIDGHGSHVAGIIAAVGNNAIGTTGVCWRARLMALKVMRPDTYIYDSDMIEAIQYATMMKNRGVPIVAINCSIGGSGNDTILKDAIDQAGTANIVFVAAAGNGTNNDGVGINVDTQPFYPACYPLANIIAVAASDESDNLASFSNYGPHSIDIAAPGTAIFSTYLRGHGAEASIQVSGTQIVADAMTNAGKTPLSGVTGLMIDCGAGNSSSDFPPAVAGNIALIERGTSTFHDKVQNAQAAGATAAIIYNNVAGSFSGKLCNSSTDLLCTSFAWIPVISVSQTQGAQLKAYGAVIATVFNVVTDYAYENGTSMATPLVTGSVALLAAHTPQASALQLKSMILSAGDNVPALLAQLKTGKRLNIANAMNLRVAMRLDVSRKEASLWLLQKDYAKLFLTIATDATLQNIAKFTIYRKDGLGAYAAITEIAVQDVHNGAWSGIDKYLDRGQTYTYKIEAYDSSSQRIGISNEVTI